MLTGSIGLPMIAEKLAATKVINDLNVVEIPPLSWDEATQLLKTLLDYENVSYEDAVLDHLLDKLEWFVPFHIQLLAQELIDAYLDTEETVNEKVIDNAFAQIIDKRNYIYFSHYYSRLKKTFVGNAYDFALAVLKALTQQDKLTVPEVRKLAEAHQLDHAHSVLRTLAFDGYIFGSQKEGETVYRFTSPVLRLWWREYVI